MTPAPTPERRLLTTQQTADVLGVTPRQVQQMTLEGTLPSVVFGRSRRYDSVDLDRFVDAHRVAAEHRVTAGRRAVREAVDAGRLPAEVPADAVARVAAVWADARAATR